MVPGYTAHTLVCRQGGHPPLSRTPSALGSFASLAAPCSSGIHTPYVSTQSCDADWVRCLVNTQLGGRSLLYSTGDLRKVSQVEQALDTVSPPPKCLKLMLVQLQETELPWGHRKT